MQDQTFEDRVFGWTTVMDETVSSLVTLTEAVLEQVHEVQLQLNTVSLGKGVVI